MELGFSVLCTQHYFGYLSRLRIAGEVETEQHVTHIHFT